MNRVLLSGYQRALPLTIALLFAIAAPAGLAQSSSKTRVEVFRLKQVSADSAAHVLAQLPVSPGFRCIADGPRQLVIIGTDEDLTAVREAVKKLDVASEEALLKVFALRHVMVHDAAEVLRSLGLQMSTAVDARTNSLIVRGPRNQLNVAEALLARLDQSSALESAEMVADSRYRMDLIWLMEGPSDASIVLQEPVQLAGDAVREIEGQGFLEVLQAGQVSVAVRSGGHFTVQSSTLLGRMEVDGSLKPVRDGKLELELSIHISNNDEQLTSLSTEITTEPDHDVVLGIAGALFGSKQRRSAFVVRITK